jgi:2-succinyl-5-enolpyruvyl-6-hydroxy-3-cyclohexene-1-carboxylate synthase
MSIVTVGRCVLVSVLVSTTSRVGPYRRWAMLDGENASPSELVAATPADVQATFCSTLVDQWIRLGVRHAVVAPGSRSTPMALAMAERDDLAVHVVHDERVAAFTALGLGSIPGPTGRAVPALLLCTSGTAAANFYPAVVEAGLSEIPMIVLTADRPEELRGVGAPQTIDQIELYGGHVRWFHDPGVPAASTAGGWRRLAVTAWAHAAAGPVQLNLPFREPLVGRTLSLPDPIEPTTDPPTPAATEPVPDGMDTERGVILVGGRHGVDTSQIVELSARSGWPIVADPTSGLRDRTTVTMIDALLRDDEFAANHRPDVVIRIGRPSTSKVLAQWTEHPDLVLIQVGGPGRIDPGHNVAAVCSLSDLLAAAPDRPTSDDWTEAWRRADDRAERAVVEWLNGAPLTEPGVARVVAEHLPDDADLTVSSSMPVRDLEWYGGRAARAHCNRGANGIDGVISTALGRALARPAGAAPSFVLIGDLAFVHDSNALVSLVQRHVDLRIVVVDNDGGGIFSFLPQSALLQHERFEQLFGTPLGTDVGALAGAHGLPISVAVTRDELIEQIGRPGPWVCRVVSDRAANVAVHRDLNAAAIE